MLSNYQQRRPSEQNRSTAQVNNNFTRTTVQANQQQPTQQQPTQQQPTQQQPTQQQPTQQQQHNEQNQQPRQNNVHTTELFKAANTRTSFIIEYFTSFDDKKDYKKISIVLIQLDEQKKAKENGTARFYLDISSAKVLFDSMWNDGFPQKWSQYKEVTGEQRTVNIDSRSKDKDGNEIGLIGYRFGVLNRNGAVDKSGYFDLDLFDAKRLAISVLDYLRNVELAEMIHSFQQQ